MADMTAPIVLLSEQQQQWLDSATENHWLRRIDFQEISHLQMGVASGGFGIVHAGKWRGMPVAIKVLFSLADFIQEVQIHRAVQDFENVVKFFGVTRMRGNGDYGMVLQFAGRGSLRDYLSKHFDKLDWTKKLRLARDVASGINFIHLENICHHDLHSRNVLIDDKGKALITDFGLSRYLNKELSNNGVRGVVPYISPERLKNAPFDKSSDIYSLGVIMWELTSGYPPFDRDGENYMLAFHITTGTREKVIPGTPIEYSELYQKCWDGEPSNRPPLSFILDTLDNLLANHTNGGAGSVNGGSSQHLGESHGPPHSLPTVTQTTVVPPEPLRKSAPIASKVPAIETTFEGQPSKPVANISPLVPKHNLSRNHPVIVTNPDAGNTVDRMQGLRVEDTAERPAGPLITPARPVWMQTPGTPNGGMGTRHIHPSSPKLTLQALVTAPRMPTFRPQSQKWEGEAWRIWQKWEAHQLCLWVHLLYHSSVFINFIPSNSSSTSNNNNSNTGFMLTNFSILSLSPIHLNLCIRPNSTSNSSNNISNNTHMCIHLIHTPAVGMLERLFQTHQLIQDLGRQISHFKHINRRPFLPRHPHVRSPLARVVESQATTATTTGFLWMVRQGFGSSSWQL
ncbi:kinase-like protein [Linnemannia elongata AG-77]|uniref:Kinase-like protein n=1 Tax=Linnemannia elongata AG-77 TaxID=1314771 RepID=A0A197JSF8_9FUNG|nr:kinase-like protein [Linnemannia elongata AG-77]